MRVASVELGHDASVPDPGDQVVPADHAVAVMNQEHEQVEYLRLDRNERAVRTQLPPPLVEHVIRK